MTLIEMKKIGEIQSKIERIKRYREELVDTNDDTLSLDQVLDNLETQIADIRYAAKK